MSGQANSEAADTGPAWRGPVIVAVLWAVAMINAMRYRLFYSDDSFISLRYARRLLDGEGLTWTDGEYVEGYSNLLWILMSSALGLVGIDLVTAPRLIGAAALFGLLWAIAAGPRGWPDWRRAATGSLFAALTGGLGVWVMGGLSQTFVAMLGVTGIVVARRAREDTRFVAVLAGVLAVATLNRIDGFVLSGVVLVAAVLGGLHWKRAGLAAIGPAIAWGSQQAFRLYYYNDWVPNTARVKVSFTLDRAYQGARWVGWGLYDNLPLVLVTLVVVALAWRTSRDALLAGLAWCAFVAYVGGDIFFGHRLMLPALPLFALAIADGAVVLQAKNRRWLAVLAVLGVVHGAWNLTTRHNSKPAIRHWVFKTTGPAWALKEHFADADPLLAVDAAGALPYYTEFRAVDMLGLTDRWLAMNPPPGWGSSGIGHDLGNGPYIWNRKPDIIAFSSGLGGNAVYLSARQLVRHPGWLRTYRRVVIGGPAFDGKRETGSYIFRTKNSPMGFVETPHGTTVPGWFFSNVKHPAIRRDGVLGPVYGKGQRGFQVFLKPGTWRVVPVANKPVEAVKVVHTTEKPRLQFAIRFLQPDTQLESVRFERIETPAPPAEPTEPPAPE